MTARKMHDDELVIDESLVGRLLEAQFPQWADLPIEPVRSAGTGNAIYRLGREMAVRLPRVDWAVDQVNTEHEWLPRLTHFLPLAIPVPLAKGKPGEGYPWDWSVYRWLAGEDASLERIADPNQAAIDLAGFITALQRIDPTGGIPAEGHNSRGLPLAIRDTSTRKAIADLRGMVNTEAITTAWEAALQAPEWDCAPVWFHGDLLPGNLLVERGRLSAVIDFGDWLWETPPAT